MNNEEAKLALLEILNIKKKDLAAIHLPVDLLPPDEYWHLKLAYNPSGVNAAVKEIEYKLNWLINDLEYIISLLNRK